MLIKSSELPIPFGAGVMDDVKYIGDGEFVVTEEWLCEVFSQAVA